MSSFNHASKFTTQGLFNRIFIASTSYKWNVLIEDMDKEHEYECIFSRLFSNEKARSFNFFATGGKQAVISVFQHLDSSNGSTGSLGEIYLVDGDFDFISPINCPISHETFIILDRYNIENYLIDKDAVERFAQGEIEKTMEHVENKVNFESWRSEITNNLCNLFVLFYMAEKNKLGIKNVGLPHWQFIDRNAKGKFKEDAYMQYRDEQVKPLFDCDEKFESELENCIKAISDVVGSDLFRIICGKYLFFSLAGYLQSGVKIKFKEKKFRWWLVNNFDIKKLDFLRDKVLHITT